MVDERPQIPAELRRRVLVEAGHRCAIPTCRHIDVDVHHIIPWEQCKTHSYDNLIALCPNCHRRADQGHIDRKSLRIYKANLRFAHDKFSQLEIDILFELNKHPAGTAMPWPSYLNLLLKRLFDSAYVVTQQPAVLALSAGIKLTPDLLLITDAGRSFISELAAEHADR